MIYLDSIAIQAQQLNDNHGLSIYSAEILSQWIIQSWTGVGSLAVELMYGSLHGTLFERYMCRLALAHYMEGDIEKAWDDFVAAMHATTEVETNLECPICYEVIGEGVQLKCDHMYHKECIHTWFDKKTTCPMCRYDIINGASTHI
tara:strand:+ start:188 stop:625 length:438 start_codon:yes stop_codon:yes gene_type:complete